MDKTKFSPSINELPGDLSLMAEVIESVAPGRGVEATIKISETFRGTNIYCHNLDKLKKNARNKGIIEQYEKGARVADLARENGVSTRHVWNILGREPE